MEKGLNPGSFPQAAHGPAGEIALAAPDAVVRKEVTDGALEVAETHCLNSPARLKASTSPWRWMLPSTRNASSVVSG